MSASREQTFDSLGLDELRPRHSEWARRGPDVLPSFLAEMDFPPAPEVAAVLHEAIGNAEFG